MAKGRGKYDEVTGELQDVPVENPKYQEKVNAFKDKVKKDTVFTPESLATAYAKLREGTGNPIDDEFTETLIELLGDDGITELKKECDLRMTAFEQMLTESHDHEETGWGMYGAGEHTVKLPDGAAVDVNREPTGKVEDKEAFRQWCIANGLESSLQLWPSTMNSIVKERCLAGESAPDGVKVFALVKVKYRRARD